MASVLKHLSAGLALSALLAACVSTSARDSSVGRPSTSAPIEPAAQQQVQSGIAFENALNAARGQRGLRPVQSDTSLTRAALAHAQDMSARTYFSHVSPEGGTPMDRVRGAGGCRAAVAENIATGQADDMRVFQGWMGSPGHHRNMMGPHYTRYGMASWQGYYVMVLAGPCV
ncbi:CAP domain-containing protein [Phaeobacter sp. CNT1-3]|nr:CAP domain-containing protein [Phaeobacter sp. CNT1-3]